MANPDWIGNAPERPVISSDGNTLYYQQKQIGSPLYDTWQLSLSGDMKPSKLTLPETVALENDNRIFSSDGSVVAWLSQGDLYVRENGNTRALTRTGKAGRLVGLIGNERVVLLQDESLVAIRLRDGFIEPGFWCVDAQKLANVSKTHKVTSIVQTARRRRKRSFHKRCVVAAANAAIRHHQAARATPNRKPRAQ